MSDLERAAQAWIADHPAARHLVRTRDWVLELDPGASEELRVAALTHDVERRVPGGPTRDISVAAWDDADYNRAHSTRSAAMVDEWLAEQGAATDFRERVYGLVLLHETGGSPDADILQAADSLSFLENNAHRVRAWIDEGRCDYPKGIRKLDYMRDRISPPVARALAEPLHASAVAALEEAFPERG